MPKLLKYFALAIVSFLAYVLFDNRKAINMSFTQKTLKTLYPAILFFSKLFGAKSSISSNEHKVLPKSSFYELNSDLNNGNNFNFTELKGKKVLIVNTASSCGYTNQFEDLQNLHLNYQNKLVILGFPSNDFKDQEKGNDETIASFCKKNYGVSFELMKKSVVLNRIDQNPVFHWLTDSSKNGWNNVPPTWNFNKYLINEEGVLTHVFEAAVSPSSDEVINAIKM